MAEREHLLLGRRAALSGMLGGMLGGLGMLAACTSETPAAGPSSTAPSTSTTNPSDSASVTASPEDGLTDQASSDPPLETGDRTRVRRALEKTEAMLAGLLSLRRRDESRGLEELHSAHRAALLGLLGEEEGPLPSPQVPPLTRADLPLREAGLQAELVAAALIADDGAVARVLAAMSAGIAQRLATLPAAAPPATKGPGIDPPPSGTAA